MLNAAWWGFLGPLVFLLNATSVSLISALRLALFLVVFSVAGLSVTHCFGLNRVRGSVIGQLSIALSLSLALVTLGSQLLGLIGRSELNWFFALVLLCLPMTRSTTRGEIRRRLNERFLVAKYELSALWFLIFGVLTTSSYVFVVGALLILVSHLILQFIFSERNRISPIDFVPIWISVLGIYLASIWLGWRYQSPWAFSLRSLDNAQWVSMAWSIDSFGWMTDATTAGFPMSYHFLAQAQSGLIARISDTSLIATLSITTPIVAAASGFAALTSFFIQRVGARSATLMPPIVLLVCLGPLEPNSPMSTEHLTYLVSIAYFGIAILALTSRLSLGSRHRLILLVAIAAIITTTKLNTAVLLPGVALSLALGCLALRRFDLARHFTFETTVLTGTVMATTWFFYIRQAAPSSLRVVIGFNSLEYRFGMIGGPYLGSLTSIFLLLLFLLPVFACLYQLFYLMKLPDSEVRCEPTLYGLSIAAVGLSIGAFFFTITPVGKPEIYFSTTGLVLAVLVLIPFARSHYLQSSTHLSLERALVTVSVAMTVIISIFSTAWLWYQRFQGWPSRGEFLIASLLPSATIGCCVAAFVIFRHTISSASCHAASITLRSGLSILILLWVSSSVSTNFAYGVRGPLNTLMGVANQRVPPADFINELRESPDQSRSYQSLFGILHQHTPDSAVIVSNLDLTGRLMISSEGHRRIWWQEITGAFVEGAGTAHLVWRRNVSQRFFVMPTSEDIRSMTRCGVTHVVIARDQTPLPLDNFMVQGLTLLRYSDDDYSLIEFIGSASDADIPDAAWLKWCNRSDT